MTNESGTVELVNGQQRIEKSCMDNRFETCSCCGKSIRYGNAFVAISRIVQQIDNNPDAEGLIASVIDSDSLADICFSCGNRNFVARRLRRQLSELLELLPPQPVVDDMGDEIQREPESCDRCGCQMLPGNTQVIIEIMAAQVDWSEADGDSPITPIFAEALFTFCAVCGNKMSTERLNETIRKVLVYADRPETDYYWDPENYDSEDDDDYDDASESEPERTPVLTYYTKKAVTGLTVSFGNIPEAMKYVVDELIAKGHGYVADLRGGWEMEVDESSCMQVIPENSVFDNKKLGLTLHVPFDPKYCTTDAFIRFMETTLYRHFERYTWKGIPCFAFRCGTDIEKLNRIAQLMLVEVFRYTTAANIECNIFDWGELNMSNNSASSPSDTATLPNAKLKEAFMNSLEPGDKILHNWHGPCEVTFVGESYIGICTPDGEHALIRKDVETLSIWSEEREESWRAAMAEAATEQEKAAAVPWPDSTFHGEPEGTEHFMGSHWKAFYGDGAEEIVKNLPEVISVADVVKGFGSINEPCRPLPESWTIGYHLVWPQPDRGVIITIAIDGDAKPNRLCTLYPFWPDGSRHRLAINDVTVWDAGVEAQISADIGGPDITFYDAHYLLNRSWYERGREYLFSLAGIAYNTRMAGDVEIPYTPNPDQIAWEKELARLRGEEAPEARPATIRMKGAAFFMPVDGWDRDDYSFHGPIKEVKSFSGFLGQDGWVVRTTVMRQSDCNPEDFDLDIVVTSRAWDRDTPPEVGQDMEGRLWLQGYLQGV